MNPGTWRARSRGWRVASMLVLMMAVSLRVRARDASRAVGRGGTRISCERPAGAADLEPGRDDDRARGQGPSRGDAAAQQVHRLRADGADVAHDDRDAGIVHRG